MTYRGGCTVVCGRGPNGESISLPKKSTGKGSSFASSSVIWHRPTRFSRAFAKPIVRPNFPSSRHSTQWPAPMFLGVEWIEG